MFTVATPHPIRKHVPVDTAGPKILKDAVGLVLKRRTDRFGTKIAK